MTVVVYFSMSFLKSSLDSLAPLLSVLALFVSSLDFLANTLGTRAMLVLLFLPLQVYK